MKDEQLAVLGVAGTLGFLWMLNRQRQPEWGPEIASLATSAKYVGWRSSEYGHQRDKSTSYWINMAKTFASKVSGSAPSGVYVIGETDGAGYPKRTYLSFPSSTSYTNIRFASTDLNEAYLKAFDTAGLKIWLQVEPCDASIPTLIDVVLKRYSKHPCVIGFGLDLEWYRCYSYHNEDSPGKPVTNAEAQSWSTQIKSYNPNYRLFLKHWISSKMPTTYRGDILFIDDSEDNGSYTNFLSEFSTWSKHFSAGKVGYQIGYPSDQAWWSKISSPYSTIANKLFANNLNCQAVYWVDFSIKTIFP